MGCSCYQLLICFMNKEVLNLLPQGVLVGQFITLIKHGGFVVKVLY
jgi:hypothetical protein